MRIFYSKEKPSKTTSAIFLDRDGVLNYRRADDYVLEWNQFEFVPGICSAVAELSRLKLPIIVISNQSAVGRGLLTPGALTDITARLHRALLEYGAFVDAFYYCTHHPTDRCVCRKPSPHMLLEAASDFRIDLAASVFIGDSDGDVLAAHSAGCMPVLFGPGLTEVSDSSAWMAGVDIAANPGDLFSVVQRLLQSRAGRGTCLTDDGCATRQPIESKGASSGKNMKISRTADYLEQLTFVISSVPSNTVDQISELLWHGYERQQTLFLFGNGGSASLASHFACDLGKGTSLPGPYRKRLRVIALTDNIPTMTAWANDSSYDDIFAEQLKNLLQPRDLVLAISCSGNSRNVLKALTVAREMEATTIGLTGFEGGKMKGLCNICLVVPSDNMQIIEDVHLSIAHALFTIVRNQIQDSAQPKVAFAGVGR